MADDRTLYVLRHAKSDWSSAARSDFDRPLAGRGHRALGLLARHVLDADIAPELVLSSSARRARETAEAVLPDAPITYDDELYGADVMELLARLRRVDPDVASVMVVGHNPGLHDLVEVLTDEDLDKFPTGALATLVISAPWSELQPGRAALSGVVRPRELE